MEPVTRRSFLSKGSLGAVGAVGALSAGPAALAAVTAAGESPLTDEELAVLDGPMFLHIRDAAAGEVEVLVDESSVVLTDHALVAKVLRAAR
jgi:hypothetical protein